MLSFLNTLYMATSNKINNFVHEERGAVDLITIVVLIGVAVALAVIFRTELENLITSLMATISTSATNAVGP